MAWISRSSRLGAGWEQVGGRMAEHGPLALLYIEATRKFAATGDTGALVGLLAADCIHDGNGRRAGGSGAEVIERLTKTRQALGWVGHEVETSAEADDVLAVVGRNVFSDGT